METPPHFLAFFRFLDHLLDVMTGPHAANFALNAATLVGAAWAAVTLFVRQSRAERRAEEADRFAREQAKDAKDREDERARLQLIHTQALERITAEAAAAANRAVNEAQEGRAVIASKLTESIKLRDEKFADITKRIEENTAITQEVKAEAKEAKMEAKAAFHEANNLNLKMLSVGIQVKPPEPQQVEVTNWPEGHDLEPGA